MPRQSRPTFHELPPAVRDGFVRPSPKPVDPTKGRWEIENEQRAERAAKRATRDRREIVERPADGPGVVRAEVIGNRVRLVPSDQGAALRLRAAIELAGCDYDMSRGEFVYNVEQMLRRGATNWSNLLLFARLFGLTVEEAPEAAERRARYLAKLDRQLAPIPRSVWVDDAADDVPAEVIAEKSLGSARI
jgi:hypothetical protein